MHRSMYIGAAVLPPWYTYLKGTSLFPRGPRPASPSSSLGGLPSELRLPTKGTPPMSSETPATPSSASSTEYGLDNKKCPLSQMSPCPTLLHYQETNAGTRNDLQTSPLCIHALIQR